MNHHTDKNAGEASTALTRAVIFVVALQLVVCVFSVLYVVCAPNSLALSKAYFAGLRAPDVMLLSSCLLLAWVACHLSWLRAPKRRAPHIAGFLILLMAALGNLSNAVAFRAADQHVRVETAARIQQIDSELSTRPPDDVSVRWLQHEKSHLQELLEE